MANLTVLLGLLSLAALAQAVDPYVCTNTCSYTGDQRPGITYMGGQQYKYEYKGEVISKTRATADEESKMSVTAEVLITARTECDHKLQIQNVMVEDVPEEESKWFREAVEKYDMHYSFQDGWMEYLCPHEDEDVAATNFKRGILSALQSTVTNIEDGKEVVVQESDVSGECETKYQILGTGDVTFNKTKVNCRYSSHLPFLPHGHFDSNADDINSPFFESDKMCKMELSQGVWKMAECIETIKVEAPFSASTEASSLATMTVTTSLTLQSGPEAAQGNFSEGGPRNTRESIRMDLQGAIQSSEARKSNITNVVEQIGAVLDHLLASTEGDATQADTIPLAFSNLFYLTGKVQDQEDMDGIWETNMEDEKRRHFLLDALMLCENEYCMRLLARLSQEDQEVMPVAKVITWLTGTHFFSDVSPEAVNITMELAMNMESVKTPALMAASTLVHKVCQADPENCTIHAEPFLEYIEEQVDDTCGYGKYPSQLEDIKVALRAVSNAGILPNKNFAHHCYSDRKVAPHLRVAALQTSRRSGCPADANTEWKILEDRSENIEVRLAAYISLIPCAIKDQKFFYRIEQLLMADDVNQVGSYIWTHIKNLVDQPSSTAYHRELSRLASHHTLRAKFNTNAFRSSRNYRYSHFNELLNMGASAESNVIFSPESYIPQQASVNFTFEMFEKTFNAFEFGGDFSGLEAYVEGFFGKDGYFKHEGIQTLLENLRPKRSVRDEKLKEFQKLYDEAQTMNELVEGDIEEPKASFYLRAFGNEFIYIDNAMRSNPIEFIRNLAAQLASPKSFKVIDQEYVSSTQIGFPLRLRVNATGSVSFEHKLEVKMTDESRVAYEGKLEALAVLALDESLMVDGYGAWSGIRRRSSKNLQTDIGAKLEQGGTLPVGVQIILPKPEVAKIGSSVTMALYKNAEQSWQDEWPSVTKETQNYCSPELLSRILGLEVCATSTVGMHTVGAENFEAEPYNQDFTISKTDQFGYYQFYFKVEENIFEAIYEAPGSSTQRKIHFLVNLGPDGTGGYIVIRGIGYGLEGQYQNTDTLKELSLKYTEDMITKGGIEMSLLKEKDTSGFKYTPKFVVTVGPDVFSIEGNLAANQKADSFKSSWGIEGTHNKIEGRQSVGQYFVSFDGELNVDEEETNLHLKSKYGNDRANAQSLSMDLDTSTRLEQGEPKMDGLIVLETTQGESNLTLSYEYSPGNLHGNGSVTVLGKHVSSQIVLKNLDDSDGRDFQVTLSLVSPQYDIDYLGQAVYKKSDEAFETEVEVHLGSDIHSKAGVVFAYERNPLLFLTGFHLSYNEHLYQAETSIDLSQPGRTQVTVSGNAGSSMVGFLFKASHDYNQPFNATLSLEGKHDDQEIGMRASVVSDEDWELFTGSARLKWFDDEFTLKHEVDWEEDSKSIALTSEDYGVLQIMAKTSAENPFMQFLLHSSEEFGDEPDFQISGGMLWESGRQSYEANMTTGSDTLFATSFNFMSDGEFSSSLTLLTSQLMIMGQRTNDLQGSAQLKVILPSGDEHSTNVSLSYNDNGSKKYLEMSSTYGDELIEGHFLVLHHDSWFADDVSGINFTIKTPFDGMKSVVLVFETHSDDSKPDFITVEWEDLKLHGLVHAALPNKFETTLRYEDGGACDSHFSIYHDTEDGHHFITGAILNLTQDMSPWSFEVNTTANDNYYEQFLSVDLDVQSPMLERPFESNFKFNLTETTFDFEIETGLEEKITLALSSKKKQDSNENKFLATIDMNSPWNEPLHVNISGNYDYSKVNMFLDLQSTLPYVQSFSTETTVNYIWPGETKVHFQLNHDDVQILMSYHQKLSGYGFTHELEGSINALSITYDFKTEWDYYHTPTMAEGKLALLNLFDRDIDLSLSFKHDSGHFVTEVSGSLDGEILKVGYMLDHKHSMEWSNGIEIVVPGFDDMIKANLSLNALGDYSRLDMEFNFNSPWTEAYCLKYTISPQEDMMHYAMNLKQADVSLFDLNLERNNLYNKDKARLHWKMSSALTENIVGTWEHDFISEELVLIEVSYGSDIHLHGKSHLKFTEEWFNREFQSYNFNANLTISEPNVLFGIDLEADSKFMGHLSMICNEYSASLNSDYLNGVIFQAEAMIPDNKYKSELVYEKGRKRIPDIEFKVAVNDAEIVTSDIKFSSVYPQLDAVLAFTYANEDNSTFHSGSLEVSATLDYNYGIKGIAKLTSNIEGFENHTLSIDTDLTIHERHLSGFFNGHLHLNDNVYRTGVNATFSYEKKIVFEVGASYGIESAGIVDAKDAQISFSLTGKHCTLEGILFLEQESPPWGLSLHYRIRSKRLNGHVTLGDGKKYSIFMKFDSKIVHINAEIIEADESTYKLLQGNVNWIWRDEKKQINLNMNSDYPPIVKVNGQLTISRLSAATLKLTVNDEKATASLRYVKETKKKPGKLQIKIKNEIYKPLSTVIDFDFRASKDGLKIDLTVGLDEEKEWITGTLNLGSPESYLRFQTPFEDIKHFNLTVNVITGKEYMLSVGLEVPQVCIHFKAMTDDSFRKSSITALVDMECSGTEKYEFIFKYDVDSTEEPFTIHTKLDLNGFTEFEVDGSFEKQRTKTKGDTVELKLEGKAREYYELGITFKGSIKDAVSLDFRVYEPSSDKTHFLFKASVSAEESEVYLEMLQDNTIKFKAEYELVPGKKISLTSDYSHSLFSHTFKTNFAGKGNFDKSSGSIEITLTTDKTYDAINFSAEYELKKRLSKATFNLSTPTGNATCTGKYEATKNSKTITVDMSSSLHTFKDYHYELVKTDNSIMFVSVQDDIKFESQGDISRSKGVDIVNLKFKTPFQAFKAFNLTLEYPASPRPRSNHKLIMSSFMNEELYMIEFDENNDLAWNSFGLEVSLFTPCDALRNVTFDFSYDKEGQVGIGLESRRGRLTIDATWNRLPSATKVKIATDLSYFNQGEYMVELEISDDISGEKSLKVSRQKTDTNFHAQAILGKDFKNGLLSLVIGGTDPNKGKEYFLRYNYDGTLQITGQFNEWRGLLKLELFGYPYSFMSGKLEISTNTENYESFVITWNVNHGDNLYRAYVQMDYNEGEITILDATLNTQAYSVATPWDSVKLDVLFESPYTLSHHLHAEYQLRINTFSSFYKYGLDTFYINGHANFHSQFATVDLSGKLPIYGFSSFELKLASAGGEQNSLDLTVSIEETSFELKFGASPDVSTGSFKTSLVSPFINPIGMTLTWSKHYSFMHFDFEVRYGAIRSSIKMNVKFLETSGNFEAEITPQFIRYFTYLSMPSKIAAVVKYDVSDRSKMYGSASLTIDDAVIEANADLSVRKAKASLNFTGLSTFFGMKANVTLEAKKNEDSFEVDLQGTAGRLKPFRISVKLIKYQFQISLLYDSESILDAVVSLNTINVAFYWDKYNSFNLTGNIKRKGKVYEFGLDFVNHKQQIISIEATHKYVDAHIFTILTNTSWTEPLLFRANIQNDQITLKVKYGEKEYDVSTQFLFNPVELKAAATLLFESSEDPLNPMNITGFWDLKEFLHGNMKSAKPLLSLSFVWKEETKFVLKGSRSPNNVKLVADIKTPLKNLPKLSLGSGWEYIHTDKHILLDFEGSIKWSKEISLRGLTKISKDLRAVEIEWGLKTPFSFIEEFTVGIAWEKGHADAILSVNNNIWKINCDFKLNPFICTVKLETPIPGLETITSSVSIKREDKFEFHAEVSWDESNTLGIQVNYEKLNLEIALITPWSPLKNVVFFTTLENKHGEKLWSATLQWDGRRTEVALVLSSAQYEFSGKHFRDAERIGVFMASFALKNQEIQFKAEIETPYDILKTVKVLLDISRRRFSIIININDEISTIEGFRSKGSYRLEGQTPFAGNVSLVIDMKSDFREMAAYTTFSYPDTPMPVNASLTYKFDPGDYLAVFDITSDEKWVSAVVNITRGVNIRMDYFNSSLEINLERQASREIVFHAHFESSDMQLETATFDTNFKYSWNYDFFNVTSTLAFKHRDQFLSRHGLVLYGSKDWEYFSAVIELFSHYFQDSYEMKFKIPLSVRFPLDIEASLSQGGKLLYRLSFETDLLRRNVVSYHLRIVFPIWEANLVVHTGSDLLKVSFSYPKPTEEHTLSITWSDLQNLERFVLSAEVFSPYLEKGKYRVDLKFSFRERVHMKLEGTLLFGVTTSQLKSQFLYNARQQEITYELQLTSGYIGDHSIEFKAKWDRQLFEMNGKLAVLGEEHEFKFVCDMENLTLELVMTSPLLPDGKAILNGKLSLDRDGYGLEITYKTNQNEISFNGNVRYSEKEYIYVSAKIMQNINEVFSLIATFRNEGNYNINGNLQIESVIPELHTELEFWYEDRNYREFAFMLTNHFTKVRLLIKNNRHWTGLQHLSLYFNQFSINLESKLQPDSSILDFRGAIGAKALRFTYKHEDNGKKVRINIITPFSALESFIFNNNIEYDRSSTYMTLIRDGKEMLFKGDIRNDEAIGRSFHLKLLTPFKGYERFSLQTPSFNSDHRPSFIVMIEYPSGKIGAEFVVKRKRWNESQIKVILWLPFEDQEIISLQFAIDEGDVTFEVRVGKFGFTLSLKEDKDFLNKHVTFLVRINEYMFKLHFMDSSMTHITRIKLLFDTEPIDLLGDLDGLSIEFTEVHEERIQIYIRNVQEEILNLNYGISSHKVLTIATPKWWPGYVHINFETHYLIDDYRVELGLAPGVIAEEQDIWDVYAFQVHQDILEGGRHMGMSGEALGGQFSIGGTIALDDKHFNDSLVFELNERKLGYEILVLRQSTLVTGALIKDISVLLPNQTVHWNTSVDYSYGHLDFFSRFTWDEHDMEMPPITLKATYDDNSCFDEEDHTLNVIFNHAENELITFIGNLTKLYDTPLIGLGELIDENAPEKNIIVRFDLDSVEDTLDQNLQFNVSQPYSNFSLTLDALIMESVFGQSEYSLKYWSLYKEEMEEVYLTTVLNSSEYGYNFIFDISAPEIDWGYNYEGIIYLLDDSTSLSLQGASKEFNDYWTFATNIRRFLPELEMKLQIGVENNEPFETGRLRLGLHNPLEMGMILDHERFGVLEQDARLGLNLKAQNILQLLFEYDPSLDYVDDDFVARITSPADQIKDAWLRDVNSTVSSFSGWSSWGGNELYHVYRALIHRETFMNIYDREESNIEYLKIGFITGLEDIQNDVVSLWTDILQPAWEATYNFFNEMYAQFLTYSESVITYLTELYAQVAPWLEEQWTATEGYVTTIYGEWSAWFMQVGQDLWTKIEEKYMALVDYLTSVWTMVSDATIAAFTAISEQVTSAYGATVMFIQENAIALQALIQPYFDSLLEAFTKYWEELTGILTGKCWESIKTKADELTTSVQEMIDGGSTFFSEFLQLEEWYNRLVSFKDKVIEIATQLWSVIEGGLTQLGEKLTEYWGYLMPYFTAVYTNLNTFFTEMATAIETEGFLVYIEQLFTAAAEQIVGTRDAIVTFSIENFEALKTQLIDYVEALKASAAGNVVFDYVNAAAGNVYDNVLAVWNRWRTEERKDLDTLQRIAFSIADIFENFLKSRNYLRDELYVWRPEDYGRVEYNQLLPVDWNSFLETPNWNSMTRIFYQGSTIAASNRAMFEGLHSVAGGWGAISLPWSMLPPFTATATIFGHHVTTFDLHHYQFLGACTYLLAKDFEGQDFEIIGDYQRADVGLISLNSLQIRGPNMDIQIFVDGMQTIKKRGSAEIHNDGDYSAVKLDDLFVTCSKVARGCSITVSGKYFGKLGGMLGNYNYEPSDDIKGPDGSRAKHPAELGSMWAISQETCYQGNQIISNFREANFDSCWRLFLSTSSPFSSCFNLVDPRPYFTHCIKGQNQPDFGRNVKKSPCDSVAAYRTQCSSQEIIHLPSVEECQNTGGTCDVLGTAVPSGWNSTLRGNTPGSADVAFVVEVANCNKNKDLIALLDALNVRFEERSTVDVRYTLVTIKRDKVELSLPFMPAAELASKLRSLVMRGPPSVGGGDDAVISAARKLKWRPGVSRNIIQLSCQICDNGETVAQAMKDNDITYHLLSRQNPTVVGLDKKKGRSLSTKIFGYDEKMIYMAGDFRKLKGDAERREFVVDEEGSCAVAAQQTNGTFFNSLKWNPKKITLTSKFLDVFAQRAVQSTSAPDCQECRCEGRGSRARLICHSCSSLNMDETDVVQEDETLSEEIKRKFNEFYRDKKTE